MLLKKKESLTLLVTTYKFLLMIQMKKILMMKNKYKKVSGFASSLLKYQTFLSLGSILSSISQNKRKFCFRFLWWISFIFQASPEKCRVLFLEI